MKDLIQKHLHLFHQDEKAVTVEKAMTLLFTQFPTNTKLEEILVKVSTLNQLYSTNIFAVDVVASHILQLNIDTDLELGNLELPGKISKVEIAGKTKKFYSFASKYCSWHKQETYPIFDSYIQKALIHFKKLDKFETFKSDDLKNYHRFVEVLKNFQTYYSLEQFSMKEIDKSLWYFAKLELLST